MFYNTFVSIVGFTFCVINFLFICLDNPNVRPYKSDAILDTCGLKTLLAMATLCLITLSIAFLTKDKISPDKIVDINMALIVLAFFILICYAGVWYVTSPRNNIDIILRLYTIISYFILSLLILPIITLIVLLIIQVYFVIQSYSERIGKFINGTQDYEK